MCLPLMIVLNKIAGLILNRTRQLKLKSVYWAKIELDPEVCRTRWWHGKNHQIRWPVSIEMAIRIISRRLCRTNKSVKRVNLSSTNEQLKMLNQRYKVKNKYVRWAFDKRKLCRFRISIVDRLIISKVRWIEH